MTELEIIQNQLLDACCPEDVFGGLYASTTECVQRSVEIGFRSLAKVVHPDHNKNEHDLAVKVFQRLNALKIESDRRIKAGTYGERLPMPECEPLQIGKYLCKKIPFTGDIADLYEADGASMLVKVARHHDDNDLMRAEVRALTALHKIIPNPVLNGLPALVSHFTIPGTWPREVNVQTVLPGFVTVEKVHNILPVHHPPPVAVWIFKRLLVLLGWVHHAGLIHGAILPPHVLVYPDNDGGYRYNPLKHSIRLIDWCYSVDFKTRTRLSSWVPRWESFYAPELLSKKSIGPTADIYMAAGLIRYLTGARPDPLEAILSRCLEKDPAKRYQKADEVFEAWKAAAKSVYGSPKWVDFILPKS